MSIVTSMLFTDEINSLKLPVTFYVVRRKSFAKYYYMVFLFQLCRKLNEQFIISSKVANQS